MLGRDNLRGVVDYVVVEDISSSLHPLVKWFISQVLKGFLMAKVASLYEHLL